MPTSDTKRPSTRGRRRRRRLIRAALCLALLGVASYVFVLPVVARHFVLKTLRGIDPDASADVRSVSLGRVLVADVRLGGGSDGPWLSADHAEIAFRAQTLLDGRLDAIVVEGLEWRIRASDGPQDGAGPSGAPASTSALDRIGRVEVRRGVVVVGGVDGDTRISFDATLDPAGPGRKRLTLGAVSATLGTTSGSGTAINTTLEARATIGPGLSPDEMAGTLRVERFEKGEVSLRSIVAEFERSAGGPIRVRAGADADDVRRIVIDASVTAPALPSVEGLWRASGTLDLMANAPSTLLQALAARGVVLGADAPFHLLCEVDAGLSISGAEAGPWTFDVGRATLAFEDWDASHIDTGLGARAIDGRLELVASGSAEAISARLLPGSTLVLGHLDAEAQGVSVVGHGTDRAALAFSVADGGVSIDLDPRSPGSAWRATGALGSALDVATLGVARSPGVESRDVVATLALALDAAPGRLSAVIEPGSDAIVGGLSLADPSVTVTGPIRIDVRPSDRPTLTISGGRIRAAGNLGLAGDGALAFVSEGVTGSVESAGLEFVFDASDASAIEAVVTVSGASVALPGADAAVYELSASVPIRSNTEAPPAGSFEARRAEVGGRVVGPIAGTASVHDGRLSVGARAALPGAGAVDVVGWFDATGAAPEGSATIDVPLFTVDDPGAFASFIGLGAGPAIGGAFGAHAEVGFRDGRVASAGRVELRDATVDLPAQGLSASGVSGTIVLEEIWPPRTAEAQWLTADTGRVGTVDIREARLAFRAEGLEAVTVDHAAWVMGDTTRAQITPFRLEFARPVLQTTLQLEEFELGFWLPILTSGRATGQGTLSGSIPLIVRPGRVRPLSLGEGHLHATKSRGWIRSGDAEMLDELLIASDDRFRTDARMREVKTQLVDALRDYEYDQLRFDLIPQRDGLVLRAFTSGRGRVGQNPQEIGGLTVNIHNIDEVLSDILSLRWELNDAADRALERFFGG